MDSDVEICRLCMAEDDVVLYSIFSGRTEESTVSKIWDCLGLKIYLGDGLPSLVCHRCLLKLNSLDDFRKMCHRSNAHLIDAYGSRTQNEEIMEITDEPTRSGIGCIVQGSERSLDLSSTFDEQEMDETSETNINNNISKEATRESLMDLDVLESDDRQKSHSSSDNSMILVRNSYLAGQAEGKKSTESQELMVPSPQSPSSSHNPRKVFKVQSGMVLIPGKVPISDSVFSLKTLPVYTDNKNLLGQNFQFLTTTSLSQSVTATPYSLDVDQIDVMRSRKIEMAGKFLKVSPKMIRRLTHVPKGSISEVQKDVQIPIQGSSSQTHSLPECSSRSESSPNIPGSNKQMLRHIKRKHFPPNLQCIKCPVMFDTMMAMEKHLSTHYDNGRPFECKTCHKTFVYSWQMTRHENVHSEITGLSCELCQKKFTSKAFLDKHMKIHNKEYICQYCDRAFSFAHFLKRHVSKCHNFDNQHEKMQESFTDIETEADIICISDDEDKVTEEQSDVDMSTVNNTQITSTENTSPAVKLNGNNSASNRKHIKDSVKLKESLRSKKEFNVQEEYKKCSLKLYQALKDGSENDKTTKKHTAEDVGIREYPTLKGSGIVGMKPMESTTAEIPKTINSNMQTVKSKHDATSEKNPSETMYTCSTCLRLYDSIDELMVHEQVEHGIRKIYSCIRCLKMFTRQSYLLVHGKQQCESQV